MKGELQALLGKIEYYDDRLVKGWALDPGSPDRSVPVQVLQENRLLFEFKPSLFRWDLMSSGFGAGRQGFVVEIPICSEAGRSGPLRFKFAETGDELENSPVPVPLAEEALWIPFEATDLTGVRVLVLAPHADDESLACGGALALHRQSGDPIKVVFLTDGSRGDFLGRHDPIDYIELRRKEAGAACKVLGVSDLEFWNFPDRELAEAPDALDRLSRLLTEYAPDLVYAPSPLEFHPDHRTTALMLWTSIENTRLEARIAFYDFNRPIHINTLIDISAVVEQKRRACDCYLTQLENRPYSQAAESLSHYRALTISPSAAHAEGYYVMSTSEVFGRPLGSFAVRQYLPLTNGAGTEKPLVSVVVRTKNRKRLLREALSSVLTQTYSNLEVVLVNDGGVDVTEIAHEFERLIPLRHVRHSSSLGRSAAANTGVRTATGSYLVFLDDDDLLYPRHVEKLVRFLETTGERMAYSDCERGHYRLEGSEARLVGDKALFCGNEFDRDRLYHGNFIPFMTAMIHRDLAEEVGPFDESLETYEDWDFWIRASELTDFYRLPGITALYRVFAEHRYNNAMEVYRKHSHYWSIENLLDSAWPRIQALQADNEGLREREAALEQRVETLQIESEALRSRAEALAGTFGMLTQSRSWRLTRRLAQLSPAWLRSTVRSLADKLLGRPDEPKLEGTSPDLHVEPVSGSGDYEIRAYRPGDETQILDLFTRCFGVSRSVEQWNWRYRHCPYGTLQISMAFDEAGGLLAHYAGCPSRFIDTSSGNLVPILACQIGDTMTAPEARTVGRRTTSILHRLTVDFFARFCEGRVGFNYGFNTGKIQRYYLRLVPGSFFVEEVSYRVLELREPVRLREKTKQSRYRVDRVQRLDEQWDEFFRAVAKDYRFLIERDRRYIQWRYLDCPDVAYEIYAVRDGDRLVGWGVFRRSEGSLIWGDALFDRRQAPAAAELLQSVLVRPESAPISRIEGWFSAKPDWWRRTIDGLSFEERPEPQGLGMIYKPFVDPDPMKKLGDNLYYMMGDGDLF